MCELATRSNYMTMILTHCLSRPRLFSLSLSISPFVWPAPRAIHECKREVNNLLEQVKAALEIHLSLINTGTKRVLSFNQSLFLSAASSISFQLAWLPIVIFMPALAFNAGKHINCSYFTRLKQKRRRDDITNFLFVTQHVYGNIILKNISSRIVPMHKLSLRCEHPYDNANNVHLLHLLHVRGRHQSCDLHRCCTIADDVRRDVSSHH